MNSSIVPVGMSSDLTNRVMKTDDIVMQIRLSLQGVEWVKDGTQKKLVRLSTPKLNEKGIQAIESLVKSFLNRNTTLSYLQDHEEANAIMYSFMNDISEHLILKEKEYEMEIEDYDVIIDIIFNAVQFAAYRSVGSMSDKDFMGKTTAEVISNQGGIQDDRSQGGIIGLFKSITNNNR